MAMRNRDAKRETACIEVRRSSLTAIIGSCHSRRLWQRKEPSGCIENGISVLGPAFHACQRYFRYVGWSRFCCRGREFSLGRASTGSKWNVVAVKPPVKTILDLLNSYFAQFCSKLEISRRRKERLGAALFSTGLERCLACR